MIFTVDIFVMDDYNFVDFGLRWATDDDWVFVELDRGEFKWPTP